MFVSFAFLSVTATQSAIMQSLLIALACLGLLCCPYAIASTTHDPLLSALLLIEFLYCTAHSCDGDDARFGWPVRGH